MSTGSDQQVGIVVVSHSEPLARAAVDLAAQMLPAGAGRIAVAAGIDDGSERGAFGTDAVRIKDAIEEVDSPAGVLVLLDMGSALLSADLALEMLADDATRERVRISDAPLVEGLVVAAVAADGGAKLAAVAEQAEHALAAKAGPAPSDTTPVEAAERDDAQDGPVATVALTLHNEHGLHARPAARLVAELQDIDARVELTNRSTGAGPVAADSMLWVQTLGARRGHEIEVRAVGPQAERAVVALVALAERGFEESTASTPPES